MTALVECCCGPTSLPSHHAVKGRIKALRLTVQTHTLGTEHGDSKAQGTSRLAPVTAGVAPVAPMGELDFQALVKTLSTPCA